MKKELKNKTIFIGVIVMFTIVLLCMGVGYSNKINEYKLEIERLTNENVKLSIENGDLTNEIVDLNTNIYNLFEKKPYELRIKHGDEQITYKQDKFSLFDSYTQINTRFMEGV